MEMDLFVSQGVMKLDAKGRVSVPSAYRAVLAREGGTSLLCCRSPVQPCIDAGGPRFLKELQERLARTPPAERERLSAAVYGASLTLAMDREGRIVLSDALKTHAGINGEVAFVGLGHKFQLWSPQALAQQMSQLAGSVRELMR